MQTVKELLANVKVVQNNVSNELEIEKLSIKSDEDLTKAIYFSLKNDVDKIKVSLKNGAIAIVSTQYFSEFPCIQVGNIRQAMSLISSNFYDNAHKKMHIIGVVGTNGKTTTTHILAHLLRAKNYRTAVIGTLGTDIDGEPFESALTTPDPIELHRILQKAHSKDINYVVMEISAHAIYFEKMYGIKCDFLIFTNISQDHLDFFGDMENYANTKINYFNNNNTDVAVVNADDQYGAELINNNKLFTLTYGLNSPCDTFAIDIEYKNGISKYVVNAFDKLLEVEVPLLGEFNVYNTLSAITTAVALGIDKEVIAKALKTLPEVNGRFNIIKSDITVIIDYAHTPDGLENILKSCKDFATNNLITVFGCGGNRDKSKRPIMGEICAKYSNIGIITSDNPRMEEPIEIINDISEGYKKVSRNFIRILDRAKAIEFAIGIAGKDDIVLIAGKGGEDYIDEKGTKRPYSDKQTAQNAIRRFEIDKVDN
jgi:UDP-N-acetylmuramoyl-L-alanyl-D-glutamate--2,6-diaminopimelate ligase